MMNGHNYIYIVCCFVHLSFVAMCNAVCPNDCYRCDKTSSYCDTCNTGYYLSSNTCYQCSDNCLSCSDNDKFQCTGCKVGYFLRSSSCIQCSDNCTSCEHENKCLTCENDFYQVQSGNNNNNCLLCGSMTLPECNSCTEGIFGTDCTHDCSLCKDSVCLKTSCAYGCIDGYYEETSSGGELFCIPCDQGCLLCESHTNCSICDHGYYLVPNTDTCIGCRSNCDSCVVDYNNCVTCVQGTWGTGCENYCSFVCYGNTCNKDTGICNEGCISGYYENAEKKCTPCSYNALQCQDLNCLVGTYLFENRCGQCPENCITSTCNRSTGNCKEGCIDGYRGPKCNSLCIGSCEACNRFTNICTRCPQGSYGNSCNEAFSNQCVNSNCNITGKCIDGCITGYVGDSCAQEQVLNEQGINGCITGYSGDSCESEQYDKDDKSLTEKQPVGVIIGAVIGGLFVVILLICVVVFVCVRRRKSKSDNDTDTTVSPGHIEANTNQDMPLEQRSMSVILPDYVNTSAAISHEYENTTDRSEDSFYDSLNGRHENEHIYKQIEMTSP